MCNVFIAMAGIIIAVLQVDSTVAQIGQPQPAGATPARSQCQIVSTTSGSLVSPSQTPTELLPNRLMTVLVTCDRPSTITVHTEDRRNSLQNGRAEIALVSSGSSGVYSSLPSTPNWSSSASFTVPATKNPGGDYMSIAARVKAENGQLLKTGSYSLRVKASIRPSV